MFKGKKVDLDEQFGGDDDDDEEEDDDEPAIRKRMGRSRRRRRRRRRRGGAEEPRRPGVERSDLDSVLESLHNKLTEKNVAQVSIAQRADLRVSFQHWCGAGHRRRVGAHEPIGKKLGSFGSLRQTVRSAMRSTRVLTPNKRVDLLAAATAARAEKRPYTIVFVGVNGVGKSTSFLEGCILPTDEWLHPMLCACDTFRAGAVEQLRVHAQSLELSLFEKAKGRTRPASRRMGSNMRGRWGMRTPCSHHRHAELFLTPPYLSPPRRYDVVMAYTAGRMQDNEPLMRSPQSWSRSTI